ncbi:MAG: hypothetical protein K2P92_07670 [Bdellovibrionaceae bacterium]|nr:hypothetical protein [Pseudobdellovibrionaceae bacterium]
MLIISTYLSHDLHLENFLNSIAYPTGHLNEYRYDLEFIDQDTQKRLRNLKVSEKIVYGMTVGKPDKSFYPFREGTLKNVDYVGDFCFLSVELGSYIQSASAVIPIEGKLVFDSMVSGIVNTTINDSNWTDRLEDAGKLIFETKKKQVCFLGVELRSSELSNDIEEKFEEKLLIPKSRKNCSIYEPSVQTDYFMDILYYVPKVNAEEKKDLNEKNKAVESIADVVQTVGPTVNFEFEISIPNQAGNHQLKKIEVSSQCNRTRFPLNFNLIKDHPLGSIVIKSTKDGTGPNLIFYYKSNQEKIYVGMLFVVVVIAISRSWIDPKWPFPAELAINLIVAVGALNLWFKVKDRIGGS